MPAGDRTGPQGQGPMTGRGLGPCGTGNNQIPVNQQGQTWGQRLLSGFANIYSMGRGGGIGRGLGTRRGWGRNR